MIVFVSVCALLLANAQARFCILRLYEKTCVAARAMCFAGAWLLGRALFCYHFCYYQKGDLGMKTKNGKRFAALVLAAAMLAAAVGSAQAAVSDVKPNSWAYKAVQYNVENNLIAVGYDVYNMNAPAPRQDVAFAMFKLLNGKDAEPSRSDQTQYIPQDMKNAPDKYKYSVQWAIQNNVIAGARFQGEHQSSSYKVWFSPDHTVNREQMAAMLYSMAKYDGLDIENDSASVLDAFTDGWSGSAWGQKALAWCVTNGFMSGVGNNRLAPKATLTFGQLAQMMMKYGQFRTRPDETPAPTGSPSPLPSPTPSPDEPTPSPSTDPDHMDLSGPWDHVQPIDELPIGGYIKDGHRYNKYDVCIDTVNGIPSDDEKRAFLLINEYRVSKGIEPLLWDQSIQVIAETRAIEGYKNHTNPTSEWAHCRPNGDSIAGLETGIIAEWRNIGALKDKEFNTIPWENAAHGISDEISDWGAHTGLWSKKVVEGWIKSPGHEAALVATSPDNATRYGAVAMSHFDTDVEINQWGDVNNIEYWYYNSIEVYND